LIIAVSCPGTQHRLSAQEKVFQRDGQVKAWYRALKLAEDREDEDVTRNAQDKLALAVEGSANAWTALARCTLDDFEAWRRKLVRLEGGLDRGQTRETKVSIWK
jgi:hypothetical protein